MKFGSFGGYRSADYDAYIAAAFAATDEDERREALYNAEQLLVEDACIAPIVFNQNFAFVNKDLSKVEFNGFGNFVLTEVKQKNYEDYLD